MQADLIITGHTYKGPNPQSIPRQVKNIGDAREFELDGFQGTWVEYRHVFNGVPGKSIRYAKLDEFARWCKVDITPVPV